jgi:CRISPR/Cas system-associated endoribonuclease Cas2
VLFDIPEKRRKIRNWLRDQLKEWDFELVQKSVWIGKGPLPKEFNERLGFFGVKEGIKVYPIHKKEK